MEARYGACAHGLRVLSSMLATLLSVLGLFPAIGSAQWIPAGAAPVQIPVQIPSHVVPHGVPMSQGVPMRGQVLGGNPFRTVQPVAARPMPARHSAAVNTKNFIIFAQSQQLAE